MNLNKLAEKIIGAAIDIHLDFKAPVPKNDVMPMVSNF